MVQKYTDKEEQKCNRCGKNILVKPSSVTLIHQKGKVKPQLHMEI